MILSVTRFMTIPRLIYCSIFRRALMTQFVYLKVQVSKVHKKKLIQQIERDYIIIDNIYIDDAYEDEVHRML